MAYLPGVNLYGIEVPSIKHGLLLFGSKEFATKEIDGNHANIDGLLDMSLESIMDKLNVGYYYNGTLVAEKRLNVKFINYNDKLYLTLKGTEFEAKFIY